MEMKLLICLVLNALVVAIACALLDEGTGRTVQIIVFVCVWFVVITLYFVGLWTRAKRKGN